MSFRDLDKLLEADSPTSRRPADDSRSGILVVDDDEMIRRGLSAMLGTRYEIRLAASARAGLDAMGGDIDAVILDVKMAGQDGFWLCQQINRRFPDVPVIFYSAYHDVKNPYDIINELHPFGYVVKDGSSRKILELVDAAVQVGRRRREQARLVESMRRGPRSTRP